MERIPRDDRDQNKDLKPSNETRTPLADAVKASKFDFG